VSAARRTAMPSQQHKNWLTICAFLVFFAALVLFATVLLARHNHARPVSWFLIAVLGGLSFAVFLLVRYFVLLRSETRDTATNLLSMGREFRSVFENVLDGILILDDAGDCAEANPAALAILRVDRERLFARRFGDFYVDREEFTRSWTDFLAEKYQRGSAELTRGDGTPLFVQYTAAADHSPGRHIVILCDVTEQRNAERSLKESENRFQQMANNIQEVFWMLNAQTKEVVYASKAYETITGQFLSDLYQRPSSYKELIHPEDRTRFLAKLEETATVGRFDEEFRIIRPDGGIRWIWSRGFLVNDSPGDARRLVGVALDITSRKVAEEEIAQHLGEAQAAQAEANALRNATLTLTKNLRMNDLLDALLETLSSIVPYDSASVLLLETPTEFLVAREMPRPSSRKNIVVIDMSHSRFLQDATIARKSIFIENTRREADWRDHPAFGTARSWICVPLVSSENLVGLLSVSGKEPGRFTREHLRLAKSLALSAAVAIRNARLYERAEIYASELELQLKLLKEAQEALKQTQGRSEEGQ